MPLLNPVFLDIESLLAQAEYHAVPISVATDVVETTSKKRAGDASLEFRMLGANVAAGTDIAIQSTYQLKPQLRAMVSKTIETLIAEKAAKQVRDASISLKRDDFVEVFGDLRVTTISLVGKLLYILRRVLSSEGIDLTELFEFDTNNEELLKWIRRVYLGNELVPIPLLLEAKDTKLQQQVYVNLNPNHFVDSASATRVEGKFRILGTVSFVVASGSEGYLSSEQWLMPDWELFLRRTLLAGFDKELESLVDVLGVDIPAENALTYIQGPAVIIDAIAIY